MLGGGSSLVEALAGLGLDVLRQNCTASNI